MSQESEKDPKPTSMNQLFDDDDDDDSDDSDEKMNTTNTSGGGGNKPMDVVDEADGSNNDKSNNNKSNNALFGSDDDSDDDEDGNDDNDGNEKTNQKSSDTKNTNFMNDSDDEGEDEFDDDGGIIGINRPKPSSTSNNYKNNNNNSNNDNIYDDTMENNVNTIHKNVNKADLVVPDMPIPQLQKNNNDDNNNTQQQTTFHITQLPKIVAIQSDPFHKESYNSTVEEKNYHGRIHNMIRWRYANDQNNNDNNEQTTGKVKKESNTSIIKWSDGTFGLRVGDEMFDLDEFSFLLKSKDNKNNKNKNRPTTRDFLYLTQKASLVPNDDNDDINNDTTTILQAVTSLKSKFIPRPSSLHSAAHKVFALESRSRTLKRAKIEEYVTFVDPEKQKQERIKSKDDLMKQRNRSSGMSAGIGVGSSRRNYGGSSGRRVGMNRGYMEDDDDDDQYDSVNIRKLKRGAMEDDEDEMDYGDDDGMSDEEDEWSKRKKRGLQQRRQEALSTQKKGRLNDSDDSENDDENEMDDDDDDNDEKGGEDDDDEEMVTVNRKNAGNTQKKADVFDDDSD